MSFDADVSSFGIPIAIRAEGCEPLAVFVSHALGVAKATDPILADLLAGMLDSPEASVHEHAWRGERREGLELCRRILYYVREDVVDRRLDVSLGYIACELAAIAAPRRAGATH